MEVLKKYEKETELFIKVCGKLSSNKFISGGGGNLAWRLEDDLIMITPTQMAKGDIRTGDLVFINMKGEQVWGTRKPTGEKPMYLKFFSDRPDIRTVVHCHPPCICTAGIVKEKTLLMKPYFPEVVLEAGPAPVVPYATPLTAKLAENFTPYLRRYNAFIMENHGFVSMSPGDIYWTYLTVELLEASADSILRALAAGLELQELKYEDVRELGKVMPSRGLTLFGAPGENKNLESLYFE